MKNVFSADVTKEITERINNLDKNSKGLWGKMEVGQMLAHCCVPYEFIYTDKHPKPTGIKKILLKLFVKKAVVGDKPYKKNSPTAPAFLIKDSRDFSVEKKRLTDYIKKTQELGGEHFNNKESHSFGVLSLKEWNTMFYKHLDHHLTQFGV